MTNHRSTKQKTQSKNDVLVTRNLTKVKQILMQDRVNDKDNEKCFALVGTDCQGLKAHLEELMFKDQQFSWDNYQHIWDIGFHISPYRVQMYNPVQKGMAFNYTNMYIKPKVSAI